MKIGIIDADLLDRGTRHPNLALMKISSYHKLNGDDVTLLESYKNLENFDIVYVSKVFSFTKSPKYIEELSNVKIGGTGFYEDGGENLPKEIEHIMPGYNLYNNYIKKELDRGVSRNKYKDYLDYSIGFTTRGCFRKCDFCVNKKYDKIFKHSPIEEFLDESRKYIYLWDDNFLGYSGWEEILDELNTTKKRFQFRQGLDIRLLTEKKARKLAKSRYHGDYVFAFDYLEDKDIITEKLTLWKKYVKKTTKLYLLTGYKSQDQHDIVDVFERIKILMTYGCLPYIMRYESYKESEYKGMYIQLARWCNQPQFYKKMSFRQFCYTNQKYHKNPKTKCASLRVMLKFEKKHPDIAKRYFDLRFEDLNQY